MKIGIDVSQLAYANTGVASYLTKLVDNLLEVDKNNEYILFFSSMRGSLNQHFLRHQQGPRVEVKMYKIPPTILDLLWNKLHILPIEWLVGDVDIFITSDWTEPPVKRAKKATIVYDLIVYKTPDETDERIVNTQRKKLSWVKKESDLVFTISESSKKDIAEILGIDSRKIKVVYPGITQGD